MQPDVPMFSLAPWALEASLRRMEKSFDHEHGVDFFMMENPHILGVFFVVVGRSGSQVVVLGFEFGTGLGELVCATFIQELY